MWKGQGSEGLVEPSGATPEEFIRSQIALPEACARRVTPGKKGEELMESRLGRFTVCDGQNCRAFTSAAIQTNRSHRVISSSFITPIVKLVVALRMPEFVLVIFVAVSFSLAAVAATSSTRSGQY
jgi:hypothetical protein